MPSRLTALGMKPGLTLSISDPQSSRTLLNRRDSGETPRSRIACRHPYDTTNPQIDSIVSPDNLARWTTLTESIIMPRDGSGIGRGQSSAAQLIDIEPGQAYGLVARGLSDLGASGRQESSRKLDTSGLASRPAFCGFHRPTTPRCKSCNPRQASREHGSSDQ